MSRYITSYGPEKEQFYFKLMGKYTGNSIITGKALIHFVRNMSLIGVKNIQTVQGMNYQRIQPCDSERIQINIPKKLGLVLDKLDPNWSEYPQLGRNKVKYIPKTVNGAYMTDKRVKNAHELISGMLAAGEKVGIRNKMFLGFGGVLGYALIGDFLWNDDDVDMCILADGIPQETLRAYLIELKNGGYCSKRLRGPRMIADKYTWFSIGNKSKKHGSGCKACNWFWFKHGGYYWHAKGVNWREEFSAKGIPLTIFNGELKEVQFGPNRINVPKKIGECIDYWYGDWVEEKSHCSLRRVFMKVHDQKDRKTWKIKVR